MRRKVSLFTVLFAFLFAGVGITDYISNVQMSFPSPASLQLGEQLNVTFDYFTTEAGGVRIFVRPITNGGPTPDYSAHGSPLYPGGSSSASGWFTINSGYQIVDHIRFRIYNNDQSLLLLECFVPVEYHFSNHSISNIEINPLPPTSIPLNQNVNITFNYKTVEAGGVRIFARPFSGGALTPNYAAHGSPLHPVGSGAGAGNFTITSGNFIVDRIRFQMLNADQSQLLLEFFVPVHYHFAANSVSNVQFNPFPPAALLHPQDVNLTFDYVTNESGGVRIFARPFSGGALTTNYAAHGSPLYPVGIGNGNGSFRITSGEAVVDQVRIQMLNDSQTQLLFETFIPVQFIYSTHSLSNIVFTPAPPAYFSFNQDVGVTFDYNTNQSGGVRIFARPFTFGTLTPNYGAHASPLHPMGSGSGVGFFKIFSGDVMVDQVRFQMFNDNQSQLLLELFVPTAFYFGTLSPTNVPEMPDQQLPDYVLEQNYPNPFNPTTTIEYALPNPGHVRMVIYDLLGRQIKTLVNTQQQAGHFMTNWDGTDEHSRPVAAGLYLCRMEAGNFVKAIKLALVK